MNAKKKTAWEANYTFENVWGPASTKKETTVAKYVVRHEITGGYKNTAGETVIAAKNAMRHETHEAAELVVAALAASGERRWKIRTIRCKS